MYHQCLGTYHGDEHLQHLSRDDGNTFTDYLVGRFQGETKQKTKVAIKWPWRCRLMAAELRYVLLNTRC